MPWVGILGLVASGCAAHELSPVYQRVGVESNGVSIGVVYSACPGERVLELTLWELDGDNVMGEEGDTVLWSASDQELLAVESSVVVPSDELGPIKLEDGARYFLDTLTTQGGGDPGAFSTSDLEPDHVLVDLRNVTSEEFVENAANSCG